MAIHLLLKVDSPKTTLQSKKCFCTEAFYPHLNVLSMNLRENAPICTYTVYSLTSQPEGIVLILTLELFLSQKTSTGGNFNKREEKMNKIK